MYFDQTAFTGYMHKYWEALSEMFSCSFFWKMNEQSTSEIDSGMHADTAESPQAYFTRHLAWYLTEINTAHAVYQKFTPQSLLGVPWKITLFLATSLWIIVLVTWGFVRTIVGYAIKACLALILGTIWFTISLLAATKINQPHPV